MSETTEQQTVNERGGSAAIAVPPDAPRGARVEALWEYDVVECFVVGADGCYFELELGAGGHYLALAFDAPRRRSSDFARESLAVEWEDGADAWRQLRERGAVRLETYGRNAGCWIMPLAETPEFAGLEDPDNVIVRSYGTVTYVGKDIAYQLWKFGLLGKDFGYRFATSSLMAMELLKERAGGGMTGSYATLGGALNSYVLSAGLVAKYYSLDAQLDKEMNVVDVGNQRAMINMLDFAEKRSKELIGLAVASGAEPVPAVFNFDRGKVAREGDVEEKLNALNNYWTASLQSQIVAMLSGKAKVS